MIPCTQRRDLSTSSLVCELPIVRRFTCKRRNNISSWTPGKYDFAFSFFSRKRAEIRRFTTEIISPDITLCFHPFPCDRSLPAEPISIQKQSRKRPVLAAWSVCSVHLISTYHARKGSLAFSKILITHKSTRSKHPITWFGWFYTETTFSVWIIIKEARKNYLQQ